MTAAPAPGGRSVLLFVRAASLVVAVAASLAAIASGTGVLIGAMVTVLACAWKYRDPRLTPFFAGVAGAILVAGAAWVYAPDRDAVEVAVVALLVAGVVSVRLSFLELRSLRDGASTHATSGVGVSIAILVALALVAFALGPSVNFESNGRRSSPFGDSSSRVTDAHRGDVGRQLAPYLGLGDSLNSAARGDLGDEVVLRVHAAAPDFWRGGAYNVWDGRVWSRDLSTGTPSVPDSSDRASVPVDSFVQRVRVEAPAISTIFAAYRPWFVSLPGSAYRFRDDGSFELRRPLGRGSEYTVDSLRPRVTAEILREHDPVGADDVPEGTMRGPVPARVAALARRITAGAPTTYDAVLAIEKWMASHTEYTLDIPPLPKGADAVEQHLFVDRKGFCVQIATSTAVMLDSLGVPVRLGTGFAPGEQSLLGQDYTVRAKDGHAWVEVWFPGVGWQAFDPTAEVPLAGEYNGSLLARLWRGFGRLAAAVAVVIAVLAFFVGRSIVRKVRRARSQPWTHRVYRRIEREGRIRGRPRRPSETPRQYLKALSDDVLPQPERLDAVADLVSAAAYGPGEVSVADQQRAEAAFDDAIGASPRPRRFRRRRQAPAEEVSV